MKPKIVDKARFTVIGIQIETTPKSPQIPALWPKFIARLPEIENRAEPKVTYGVMRHPVEGPARLSYLAAVSVSDAGRVPPGMIDLVIPASTYAVFTLTFSGLAAGFDDIYNKFLPASDYVQIPGPYFERYDESFHPASGKSLIEVHLPVVLRGSAG